MKRNQNWLSLARLMGIPLAVAAFGFGILVPQTTSADHIGVVWHVDVLRDGVIQNSYESAGDCEGVVCENQVFNVIDGGDVTNRDRNLFERLCGSNPFTVIVEPSDGGVKTVICEGNGPWEIHLTATLQDADGNPISHETDVAVVFDF